MPQNNAMAYEMKLDPLCPVAIKKGQSDVYAPAHETWGTVTCDECDEQFWIGPNRIYGSRITAEEAAKRLEEVLDAEHKTKEKHQNSYVLRD